MSKKCGGLGSNESAKTKVWHPWPIFAVNELDWQCCFAGSSKTARRILIFSIAIGADAEFH